MISCAPTSQNWGEKTKKKNPGSSLSSAQFLVGFCVGHVCPRKRKEL